MDNVESNTSQAGSEKQSTNEEPQKVDADLEDTKKPSLCFSCNQEIIQCEELVNSLISVNKTSSLTESNENKVFALFTCRVCDYADLRREKMIYHMTPHFETNEVLYCLECQDKANQLKLGIFHEHEESIIPYETLLNNRTNMAHFTLEHIKPVIPNCRTCIQSFGYLIPLLNRIIIRYGDKGYECNICNDMERHIGRMLKHVEHHIESRELRCSNCLKQHKTKEEISTERENLKPLPEEDEIQELTESEYQKFEDELRTAIPPPLPIQLSLSSEICEPQPESNIHNFQISLSSSESLTETASRKVEIVEKKEKEVKRKKNKERRNLKKIRSKNVANKRQRNNNKQCCSVM